MTAAQRVEVTEELYNRLLVSQADNLREQLGQPGDCPGTCDDSGDYLMSSLDIMHTLVDLSFQQQPDLVALDRWLNTPLPKLDKDGTWPPSAQWIELHPGYRVVPLGLCASDGVGAAFWNLNCPALAEED